MQDPTIHHSPCTYFSMAEQNTAFWTRRRATKCCVSRRYQETESVTVLNIRSAESNVFNMRPNEMYDLPANLSRDESASTCNGRTRIPIHNDNTGHMGGLRESYVGHGRGSCRRSKTNRAVVPAIAVSALTFMGFAVLDSLHAKRSRRQSALQAS